jgi:uncharacterized protein YjcR
VDEYQRAYWYIVRGWPVVAIAAIVEVAPNTIRAWQRRLGRERIRSQIARARPSTS